MVLYLLRSCCQPWQYDQPDADRRSWYARSFDSSTFKDHRSVHAIDEDRRIYRKPYVVLNRTPKPKSEFDDNSFVSYSVPSSIPLSEASVSGIDNRTKPNGVRNYTINVTRNYFVENSPPVKAKSSLRATRVLHESIFFTVNMAVEEITDDPNWEMLSDDLVCDTKNNRSLLLKQAVVDNVVGYSLLSQQNIRSVNPPAVYLHQPKAYEAETNPLHFAIVRSHSPWITNEIVSSTETEMSGHDSESAFITMRPLTPEKALPDMSTDTDEYKTADIDEVQFQFQELFRVHKPNEPYKEFFLTSALSALPIFPEHDSYHYNEVIEPIVQTQPIEAILDSIDGNEIFALPVSSRARYEEPLEMYY
ncbi:unnamed protein product [Adineta ricciae]|uniref:Uncharacterized protein n=1 Tax=Adineta ricciae TaxID=249248 RepID=A0A813T9P7_ADIRI|nr:unnamed protein product [Adineta ricciae]CAF1606628.1 unnamed protein product [Adineta ricciae]